MVDAPGVKVIEKEEFPKVQNAGATISGVIIRSARGRDDIATLNTNLAQFITRYGSASSLEPYGYETAKDYFEEGGTGLYVIRANGSNTTQGSGTADYSRKSLMPAKTKITSVPAVGGITSAAAVVTVADAAHTLLVGDSVVVSGCLQTAYNGTFIVTAVTAGVSFQYNALSTPTATPATGSTGLTTQLFTDVGTTITMTTLASHGKEIGDKFLIAAPGAPAGYLGVHTVTAVSTDKILDFEISPAPGADSNVGTLTLDIPMYTSPTMTIRASSVGSWANTTYATVAKYATLVGTITAKVDTTLVVASVTGIEVGDVIRIYDAITGAENMNIVISLVVSSKTLTLRSAVGAVFPTTSTVECTSTHKTKTTVATTIPAVTIPTQITVASAATIDIGALLLVVATGRVAEFRVTGKNGNVLNVTMTYGGGNTTAMAAGSAVVSINFTLIHTVDTVAKAYPFMTLEEENVIGYIVNALSATEYLRATRTSIPSSTTYESYTYPGLINTQLLAGGVDATPTANDFLGTNTDKVYAHGLTLFDSIAVLPQFGSTGSSDSSIGVVVSQGMNTYAEGRADTIAVLDAPLLADTFDELMFYRNVTLNLQTSYSALYAPWLIEADQIIPGAQVNVPPTGKVLGTYSEVANRRGTHKAPANEPLTGVLGVTANFTDGTDSEFALLNDGGVNLIRNVSGRGIRIAGARTLWPNADRKRYVNVRRVMNSVKIGFRDLGILLGQEPNDDVLWSNIQSVGRKFLETLWLQGWFFPRGNPDDAFFFVCDATTNTEDLRLDAKVRAIAGINPVLPAELIQFELSLFSGGAVNVNEL